MRVLQAVSWTVVLTASLVAVAACASGDANAREAAAPRAAGAAQRSRAAFAEVARVLRHPRCLNCHPSGDIPLVGDARSLHPQNVRRGAENHGMPGLRCSACHQDVNQDLAGVPGAPHWALAPRPMGWEGLDDHELAAALTDPRRNGGRSLDDLLDHMANDPLVGWAWDPGRGRAAPPVSREEFVDAVRVWIEEGAALPAPGTTSTF